MNFKFYLIKIMNITISNTIDNTDNLLKVTRIFTNPSENLLEKIEYEYRTSQIIAENGKIIHQQENVEVPKSWSQVATDILSQKYFRRKGVPTKVLDNETVENKNYDFKPFNEKFSETGVVDEENSIKQVAHRLAGTWTYWGKKYNYFHTDEDANAFYDELKYCIIDQICVPNSPQWFNTGLHWAYGITGKPQGHYYVEEVTNLNKHLPSNLRLKKSEDSYSHPQPHACFIQHIDDDLVNKGGIFDLLKREAIVFKYGSGTGSNFSNLRAKGEKLEGGGTSSGLMSFLSIFDKAAGSIKSGGTTRRAAKMVCLDIDHPEIEDFINWKVKEERKVASLVSGSKLNNMILKNIVKFASLKDELNLKKEIKKAKELFIPLNYIKRVLMLVDQGSTESDFEYETYDTDFRSESYTTVDGQNSNNSIRVTNEFMSKVFKDQKHQLLNRVDGAVAREVSAKELWNKIAVSAWQSADPGIQFDTTINEWNTCSVDERINSSNPCSEYMFLDETACNLASINLDKFLDPNTGIFNYDKFIHVVRLWTIVLELSVLMSQLISDTMALRTYQYRTIGLGYANLGTIMMKNGIAYDSKTSTTLAAGITALMTGVSYTTSAEMAKAKGPFERFEINREPMLKVIRNHRRAAYGVNSRSISKEDLALPGVGNNLLGGYEDLAILPIPLDQNLCDKELLEKTHYYWDRALEYGELYGFRNAQVTLIAPTGTIGLVMDCQTTGVEPDFALVKFKKLVGGGYFKLINQAVEPALKKLGYKELEIKEILNYIEEEGTFEQAPNLKEEHYSVFDCANKCGEKGKRFISPMGHVNMLAAVQPFVSGSISKTINLPEEATVEDIKSIYKKSWELALKCNAIYRDSSKLSQPLSVGNSSDSDRYNKLFEFEQDSESVAFSRKRLPEERNSITHKFNISGHEGYLTVGLYKDGTPGEVFIGMSKEGSTLSGIVNAWAITISLALQYGVPMETLVRKYTFTKFEPSGFTGNKNIPIAQSIVDYIGRWLALKFLPFDEAKKYHNEEILTKSYETKSVAVENEINKKVVNNSNSIDNLNDFLRLNNEDSPTCSECGTVMVRNGTCYKCLTCGTTTGCS